MYFHNSLIPRGAYFLLPLESKQEATSGWNFTKCISEVKVNQLKVKNTHVKMGISTFKIQWKVAAHKKCSILFRFNHIMTSFTASCKSKHEKKPVTASDVPPHSILLTQYIEKYSPQELLSNTSSLTWSLLLHQAKPMNAKKPVITTDVPPHKIQ